LWLFPKEEQLNGSRTTLKNTEYWNFVKPSKNWRFEKNPVRITNGEFGEYRHSGVHNRNFNLIIKNAIIKKHKMPRALKNFN